MKKYMPTLSQAWEMMGSPRPPFYYIFHHTDPSYNKKSEIKEVRITPYNTIFVDESGAFNGDMIHVKCAGVMREYEEGVKK